MDARFLDPKYIYVFWGVEGCFTLNKEKKEKKGILKIENRKKVVWGG